LNLNTDADKLSVVMTEFIVKSWIVLRLEMERVIVCCKKKYIIKKEKWEKGREKKIVWLASHKLNIINNIIYIIILSTILSFVLSIIVFIPTLINWYEHIDLKTFF
jgi:hypothetical protein